MNDAEAKRLAHAINDLRPSWPISSLTTFIARHLSNRNYRDAAVALVYVALEQNVAGEFVTQTPKRVLETGPWWKAAEINGTAGVRPRGPKPHEACRDCGGFRGQCACQLEKRAASDEEIQPMSRDELRATFAANRRPSAKEIA